MEDVAAVVPPTPEPLGPSEVLASLSEPQLLEWRKTGALPEPSKIAAAAESAPAEPVAQAASTDATPEPASEPAKPAKGAKARSAELDAEIKELNEKLRIRAALREELEQRTPPKEDAKPAASSPAPVEDDFPSFEVVLQAYPETTYERYLDARSDFRADKRQQIALIRERSQAVVAEAVKADPTFGSKVSPAVAALKPLEALAPGEPKTMLNELASLAMKSPLLPVLMIHFSEHPEELQRFASIPEKDDFKYEFGKLEGRLSSAPAQAAPQPKTQTDAPLPGTTLGSKPATPGDPVLSAIRQHDTGAYIKEMNARELAARKR